MINKDKAEELPRCASLADVMSLHGQRVQLQGLYDVARVAGSKRLQPATIRLNDGTSLLRAYRPVPDEFNLLERKVKVIGTVSSGANPDPMVQQVVAPSVRPEQLKLREGEAPYPVDPPGVLPLPPEARDLDDLAARLGLWVRVRARLDALEAHENDPMWGTATLGLADGGVIRIPMTSTNLWDGLKGQVLRVVGQLAQQAPAPGTPHTLFGPTRISPQPI
jgi:hypothetical protein